MAGRPLATSRRARVWEEPKLACSWGQEVTRGQTTGARADTLLSDQSHRATPSQLRQLWPPNNVKPAIVLLRIPEVATKKKKGVLLFAFEASDVIGVSGHARPARRPGTQSEQKVIESCTRDVGGSKCLISCSGRPHTDSLLDVSLDCVC
ncbi:hypothetical protein RRG08_055819 [Elysia crispata]|uniref:Uncharacterized protein n=1 Tax=Elysia crispata TaxID=231223 RepID=A0AAE1E5Q5_9GAST|nr:hypothetical protein RRG08_055819 [Elysia crispata]